MKIIENQWKIMEFVEVIGIRHTKRQQHPKKAKVTFICFDLQFCMTMPLRGW